MKRASGVLLPIFSLYGDYSCGSFGKPAFDFIDFLSDSGFSYWQILPLCIPDGHNSPYMSYSSFGGNPYLIDIETLYKKNLLTESELKEAVQKAPWSCEYEKMDKERFNLLKCAALRISDRNKINEYILNNPRTAACAEFMALKYTNNGIAWNEWKIKEPDKDVLFTWQFIQYEFASQWDNLHKYANEKGIKIIGDIPFYVAYDSCDVWQSKEDFLIGDDLKPEAVAGVPPDYFSEEGQLWGNPLYNWDKMKKDGYAWWKDRLSYALSMFDGVRIDHFRAISEYWSVPYKSKTAKDGHWEEGPGREFIDKIKEIAGEKLIIAENLGIIDNKVTDILDYSGFPGMSVFQFGFDGISTNPHLVHNFKNNLIAYTGTHDNNTLLGFMWEIDENTRKNILEYIGYSEEDWNHCYESILRILLMSNAGIVIFPIQDLLGYGSDTRLNTPGKADGNWKYRITKEQLDSINREKFNKMNSIYSRI